MNYDCFKRHGNLIHWQKETNKKEALFGNLPIRQRHCYKIPAPPKQVSPVVTERTEEGESKDSMLTAPQHPES